MITKPLTIRSTATTEAECAECYGEFPAADMYEVSKDLIEIGAKQWQRFTKHNHWDLKPSFCARCVTKADQRIKWRFGHYVRYTEPGQLLDNFELRGDGSGVN